MKQNRHFLKVLLCLVLVLAGVLTMKQTAQAKVWSETYQEEGRNQLHYTYDTQTGILKFSGKGLLYAQNEGKWYDLEPTKIIIGEGIRAIDNYCFSYQHQLKEVVLPTTLNQIGEGAFSGCQKLETIVFPEGLKQIGSYAFSGAEALTDISLPKGIKSINASAFRYSGLTSLRIPKDIRVGDYAFANCKSLKSAVYRAENIPYGLFSGCEALTELKLRTKAAVVGERAFEGCGFTELSLPSSVEKIGSRAFRNCGMLKSFVIPKKVTTIECATFRNCIRLSKLTIGKNVTLVKERAFVNCNLGKLVIPGNVVTLDYGAFRRAGITAVELEDGVETIGDWAFSGNPNLKRVIIPETVSVIQENAFTQCPNLMEFQVAPENGFFSTCDGMLLSKDGTKLITCPAGKEGTVTIPSSVITLTEYSFNSCRKLTAYALSGESPIYSVKDGVLYDTAQTTLIRYPQGISGCIEIPVGVSQIGAYAFAGSVAEDVIIPYTTTKIGVCAFENCKKLTDITIPGNVKTIAAAAFWNCKRLEKVTLESGCEHIRRLAFSKCKKLTIIRIPTSVTTIARTSFSDTIGLTIYCPKQSFALAYAKNNYFYYKLI